MCQQLYVDEPHLQREGAIGWELSSYTAQRAEFVK